MSSEGISQTEDVPQVQICTILPLIESFVTGITTEQWELLKAGTPDFATKVKMAELLLNILTAVSDAVLKGLKHRPAEVSVDMVRDSLGDAIALGFAQALDAKEHVQSESSEKLSTSFSAELTESINSSLSPTLLSAEPTMCQHITPAGKLNAMVGHACNMLKVLIGNMKIFCKPRPRKGKTASPKESKSGDMEAEHSGTPTAVTPVEPEASETDETPEDIGSTTSFKSIKDILIKEWDNINGPLLEDVTETSEVLSSENSWDTESVAKSLADLVEEHLEELEETGPEESQEKTKECRKKAGNKIKALFGNLFAKSRLYGLLQKLKAKFQKTPKEESRESFHSFMQSFQSLLMEEGEKPVEGKELCIPKRFAKMSPDRVLMMTQLLSDLIYSYVTQGTKTDFITEPTGSYQTCRTVAIPQSHAAMYGEIRMNVWTFLEMMRWWVKTQAAKHSEGVTTLIMGEELPEYVEENEPLPTAASPEPQCSETPAKTRTKTPEEKPECTLAITRVTTRPEKPVRKRAATAVMTHVETPVMTRVETPVMTRVETPVMTRVETPAGSRSETHSERNSDTRAHFEAIQVEKNRMAVEVLAEKLCTRVLKKNKVTMPAMKPEDIIRRLSERTWAEVEGINFFHNTKTFRNLDKAIFKDLCKKWGGADLVLIAMKTGEPALESHIAAFVKNDLTTPANTRNGISRFFSSARKAIANVFRCGAGVT